MSNAVPSGPIGGGVVLYPRPVGGMESSEDCYELFVSPVFFFLFLLFFMSWCSRSCFAMLCLIVGVVIERGKFLLSSSAREHAGREGAREGGVVPRNAYLCIFVCDCLEVPRACLVGLILSECLGT